MNYYSDEMEWKWLFKNAIDWDKILPLYYPEFPTEEGFESKKEVLDFLEELLASTGEWAANSVATRAARLDVEGAGKVENGRTIPGPALSELYREATELSVFGVPLPKKYGGLETPASASMVGLAQLARACIASSTQVAFFTSIGEMLNRFGDEEVKERIIPKIVAGEISGCMCLTEPGCGSDLGSLITSATPQDDGTYLINGSKIFITNGGGGVGLVLARIKGAPNGLEGISMFLVEQDHPGKEGLNYTVAKNEHKMGMHGSFTTEIVYENSIGKLVGEPQGGFKAMLHLMNEARLVTGFQALGGIEASLSYARKYATERIQFGKPIAELPLMKRNLIDFEAERDALRALLVDTLNHFEVYQRLDLKKTQTGDLTKEEDEMFEEAKLWTRKRTPLVKYYSCELASVLTIKGIQILGGYGYMKEYPVERIHRDIFGPLLYEGTSQIQALMALKDMVKYAVKEPKRFASNVVFKHTWANPLKEGSEWMKNFKTIHFKFKRKLVSLLLQTLKPEGTEVFSLKSWAKEENINKLMTHAETLCQALAYIETLRVLCDHTNKEEERKVLYFRYRNLVQPRLEAIYVDWSLRT